VLTTVCRTGYEVGLGFFEMTTRTMNSCCDIKTTTSTSTSTRDNNNEKHRHGSSNPTITPDAALWGKNYPFTRQEEMSWHPEEVARNLCSLLVTTPYPHSDIMCSGSGSSSSPNGSTMSSSYINGSTLLNRGLHSHSVPYLRTYYGCNSMKGEEDSTISTSNTNTTCTSSTATAYRYRYYYYPVRVLTSYVSYYIPWLVIWLKHTVSFLIPLGHTIVGQLKEPLILILLGSALLSLALGNSADAISIAIALAIVSLVAAIQEYRSEQALERLTELMPHTACVIRDGILQDHLPADQLVVGDLVLLSTGDYTPADIRIVDSVELSFDESSLTGENHSVHKSGLAIVPTSSSSSSFSSNILTNTTAATKESANTNNNSYLHNNTMTTSTITDQQLPISFLQSSASTPQITSQRNIAFMGTCVTSGRGRGFVIATGKRTEFGKVAAQLQSIDPPRSPLQIQMDTLARLLAFTSSVVIIVIAIWGYWMGRPFLETLTVAVSLAVAAIPEGLPICVTVTLALGVLRMARRNAIVKSLPKVETLGCASVVATDKTGTLTTNQMTVRSIWVPAYPHASINVTGVGYYPATVNTANSNTTTTSTTNDNNNNKNSGNSGGKVFISHPRSHSGKPLSGAKSSFQVYQNDYCREYEAIQTLFAVGCLCNNATLYPDVTTPLGEGHCGPAHSGQPTELALLVGASKVGLDDPRPLYHRIQEVPFSSDRKRMEVRARPVGGTHICASFRNASSSIILPNSSSTSPSQVKKHLVVDHYNTSTTTNTTIRSPSVGHGGSGSVGSSTTPNASNSNVINNDGSLYFVKGMPEAILNECTTFTRDDGMAVPLTEELKRMALIKVQHMASHGLRVLAMSYGPSLGALTFAGLTGMEDPPREGVYQAVMDLKCGDVKVLMVTGDSKETAVAIARKCGILESNSASEDFDIESSSSAITAICLSGEELDNIPQQSIPKAISGINVFYRVAPRHKLLLVKALQSMGEIVAMTGGEFLNI
jgi:magnesium-transporting ATPase (P-type)